MLFNDSRVDDETGGDVAPRYGSLPVNDVSDSLRSYLLHHFGVTPKHLVAKGMEAEVYRYDADHVLKLYSGTASLARLRRLQEFYARLDTRSASYALPQIDTIIEKEGSIITLEKWREGRPMSDLLPSLDQMQLEQCMQTYLAAALELQGVGLRQPLDRYKLFDEEGISSTVDGDWHQFLMRLLAKQLGQVAPYLAGDVADFDAKVRRLQTILAQPYMGQYTLIHGDFFPGNLLVDAAGKVTALLDFGLLTMIGDYLFDIATSWVFFDMYDTLQANLRERYLAMVLDRLGEHARGVLYRYVLLYSMISANTYSRTCEDGHYQWCVANLNNAAYWRGLH